MVHSLNPILHVVNPKVYEGRFSPYTCGIGLKFKVSLVLQDFSHSLHQFVLYLHCSVFFYQNDPSRDFFNYVFLEPFLSIEGLKQCSLLLLKFVGRNAHMLPPFFIQTD